ncbi:hypothetical protein H2198_008467 [Neophaeococcomyces mojaviensis]|uniref:Uncharacterized protein n=1 Tax=Neophaeococcomyces mojaviensis TaxID=3383035 RepID=A0ACC2ZXB2_9EURO|nr:hypothetical protein H2198_008467 [Knufia sp. JES_112]
MSKLQALAGGGYSTGFGSYYMTQAVASGYVAIETDGGHTPGPEASLSPRDWALTSPGNVNLYLLQDYASRSLGELSPIGKAITESYYNIKPKFSCFTGCSEGGRQGLLMAQRYPDSFDGILALAPAVYLQRFIPAGYWASQVMNDLGVFPPPCEIEAFTQAAIDTCDKLDGVEDGIIGVPHLCNFSAHSMVGQSFSCNGIERRFTAGAASVVQAAWTGPGLGKTGWFGLEKDTPLTSFYVKTGCSPNGTCAVTSHEIISDWIVHFLAKDPNSDLTTMSDKEYFAYLQLSNIEYSSMLSTANTDLSRFRTAGGKMITWHGLADDIVPPKGPTTYYQQVLETDPHAAEYYRFYEAPGVRHCFGGPGPVPYNASDALVAWVEKGTAPETLNATGSNGVSRPLCPYPSRQIYAGADASESSSFRCVPESVAL